jgi:hypothetical protein
MTGTTSCDRAGVRMLAAAHWKATTLNSELRLVVVSTAVRDALAVVKLGYLPPIYATLRDATAAEHSRDTSPPTSRREDDHLGLRAADEQEPAALFRPAS